MGSHAPLQPSRLAPPRLPGSYLVLELTNLCSLACVHCAVSEKGHPHHAATGMMEPALFESVIDDLVDVGGSFDSLVMFWLGEPLLHPFFDRLRRHALRAAVRHGSFGRIEVHSNATHLSPERVQAILNQADLPQVLHFSLDAITRQTYLEIKGMDRFEQVQSNIEHFIGEKVRRGARWPRPVFQFIVGSNNRAEVGRFREYWEKICRRFGHPVRAAAGEVPPGEDAIVFFRQLDCPSPEQQEAENAVFREEMTALGLELPVAAVRGHRVNLENLTPCSGFWKSPVVGYRGELTTCTLDSSFQNSLGNVGQQRFSRLWWGERIDAWRDQVSRGDYSGRELCQTCFIPHSINYADLSEEDVNRQANWSRELRS